MMSASEMNSPKETELMERLEADSRYRQDFEAVFGGRPTIKNEPKRSLRSSEQSSPLTRALIVMSAAKRMH